MTREMVDRLMATIIDSYFKNGAPRFDDWWLDTERARYSSAARYYPATASMHPWARDLYVALMATSRKTLPCPWCGSPLISSEYQDHIVCGRHGPITAEFLEDYGHLKASDALIELRARQAHEEIVRLARCAALSVDALMPLPQRGFRSVVAMVEIAGGRS